MVRPTIHIHIGMAVGAGVVLIGVTGAVVGDGVAAGAGEAVGAVAGTAATGTGNSITRFNLRKICSRVFSSGAFFV
jgi:hypothetical protein